MTGLIGRRLTEERRRHVWRIPLWAMAVRFTASPGSLWNRLRFRRAKRMNHSAGNTASTPFFFSMTTRNFAGFVALALRPTVCTSLGPS
jgi:hypothetical protein